MFEQCHTHVYIYIYIYITNVAGGICVRAYLLTMNDICTAANAADVSLKTTHMLLCDGGGGGGDVGKKIIRVSYLKLELLMLGPHA